MQSSSSNYLSKFHEQFDFFMNLLSDIFNNNPEIQSRISMLRLFEKTNVRKVSEFIYHEFIPYEKEINEMNQNFFLDLANEMKNSPKLAKYEDEFNSIINLIYLHIDDPIMNENSNENSKETNKIRIWKYIRVLLFLTKKLNE
jgi:hypothetical protein